MMFVPIIRMLQPGAWGEINNSVKMYVVVVDKKEMNQVIEMVD